MSRPKSGLRQFLDALGQQELLRLADKTEVPLTQRQVVMTIRQELFRKKARVRNKLHAYLNLLPLQTLKSLCGDLDLVSAGNTKSVLQKRIEALVGAETSQDDEDVQVDTPPPQSPAQSPARPKIFIVHGHDFGMRKDVEHFLDKHGIDAIILANEPSGGKTIIEKLEAFIKPEVCPHAIVLFSPDDVGNAVNKESDKHVRARQNVLFEYGMVVGKLGRSNVILMHRGRVEVPTDIHGVNWISYEHDDHDSKISLGHELQAMGYHIDFNITLKSKNTQVRA